MRNGRWRALEGPASHAAADGGTYPNESPLPYVVRIPLLFPVNSVRFSIVWYSVYFTSKRRIHASVES